MIAEPEWVNLIRGGEFHRLRQFTPSLIDMRRAQDDAPRPLHCTKPLESRVPSSTVHWTNVQNRAENQLLTIKGENAGHDRCFRFHVLIADASGKLDAVQIRAPVAARTEGCRTVAARRAAASLRADEGQRRRAGEIDEKAGGRADRQFRRCVAAVLRSPRL